MLGLGSSITMCCGRSNGRTWLCQRAQILIHPSPGTRAYFSSLQRLTPHQQQWLQETKSRRVVVKTTKRSTCTQSTSKLHPISHQHAIRWGYFRPESHKTLTKTIALAHHRALPQRSSRRLYRSRYRLWKRQVSGRKSRRLHRRHRPVRTLLFVTSHLQELTR